MYYKDNLGYTPDETLMTSERLPSSSMASITDVFQPIPEEIVRIQEFVQTVFESNEPKMWNALFKSIELEGSLRLMPQICRIQIIEQGIRNTGENQQKDLCILQCIEFIVRDHLDSLEIEVIQDIIEAHLNIIQRRPNRKLFYCTCKTMMLLASKIAQFSPSPAEIIFDSLYLSLYERSIDTQFDFSVPMKALTEIVLHNEIPEQKLFHFMNWCIKRLTTNNWYDQLAYIESIRATFIKVPVVAANVLETGLLQNFTMKLDPISSPAVCVAICDLFSSLDYSVIDEKVFDHFDLVGRMKGFVLSVSEKHEIECVSALRCYLALSRHSNYSRIRLLQEKIYEKIDFDNACFVIKSYAVQILESLMRGPWIPDLLPSEALFDVTVSMLDDENHGVVESALFIIYTMIINEVNMEIPDQIEELADSEHENIAAMAGEILKIIQPDD